ncbi:MAG: ABC transporter substrate-binding protein [Geminicoccaceae bacterium]|nr:ABC transporter substrate-binding protein [Geminicoccaceae bacterium]
MRTGWIGAAALLLGAQTAWAATELRFMCYQDGNECDVAKVLLEDFHKANPDIRVTVDIVPYKAILESLPVQLAAGQGPDLARVTDLGGLNKYYLDIAPFVNAAYWEENFGTTLPWFRSGPADKGIYGMMTQLTITGAFVNKTLFDQAKVPLPGPEASWDQWAEATRAVAKATQTRFPMAIDRSGHRVGGPAISYGARIFAADGTPRLADDGFKAFMAKLVAWTKDGTMARDVWVSQGGAAYQDAAQEFVNGRVVYYYSGSWQTGRFEKAIGDAFDWEVVGSPCGPAACTGMPGGAALVGFKRTAAPQAVAKVLDFFAAEPVHAQLIERTKNVPAHKAIAAKGLAYPDASPAGRKALQAWSRQVAKVSPVAYAYQGYPLNRAMFNATVTRVTQAMVGELSFDDAMAKLDADVAEAVAQAKK